MMVKDSKHSEEQFLRDFLQARAGLQSYIYALVGSHAAADDILQEVSVVLWQKYGSFLPGTNFGAWARCIARYKVLNERRRKKDYCWAPDVVAALEDAVVAESGMLDEMNLALTHCLEELSAVNRSIIQHHYGQDKTCEEIGQLLQRSPGGIKVILHRIRSTLRDCIWKTMQADIPC